MKISSFTSVPVPPTSTFTITLSQTEAEVLDCILGWNSLGSTNYGERAARDSGFNNVADAMHTLALSIRCGLEGKGFSRADSGHDTHYADFEVED